MKKKHIILLVVILVISIGLAISRYQLNSELVEYRTSLVTSKAVDDSSTFEETLDSSFMNYEFPFYSLYVPNTMELRGEDSFSAHVKEAFSNHIKRTKKIDINNFKYVFQPAGLDNMHDIEKQKAANKLYSRILINHVKGEKGDFAEYDCDISFSVEEYKELNQTFKENLRNEAALAQGVFSTKIIKIGNIVVAKNKHKFAYIKQEYLRSGLNGDVEVIDYYIFNNDEMVKLTTSFRVSERKLWEKDFEKIINTFSFNTKK